MQLTLCCPTLFGLEGIVADELRFGGRLTDVHAENGRVLFTGDENTLAWANLNLRCAERVLIRIGTVQSQNVRSAVRGRKSTPVEQFIPATRISGQGSQSGLSSALDSGLPEDHQKGSCIAPGRKVTVKPGLTRSAKSIRFSSPSCTT